jgi:hypothetical protein
MSFHPSLDPESFEAFLANAFEVQHSGLDAHSLSVVVEIQRFVAAAGFDLGSALHLIADRALKVSNAGGIAIALLESNELVYRAGSGCAAIQVGRHVSAVLCARSEAQAEILRVEDAQHDSRVQADICKRFGAMSLLILPVYRDQAISGVLQVHFSEPHVFLDREVRAYRLLAGFVGEAISRNLQSNTNKAVAAQPATVPVVERTTCAPQLANADDEHQTQSADERQRHSVAIEEWATLATAYARQFAELLDRIFANDVWPVAATISAAILLTTAALVAHHHYAASTAVDSTYAIPKTSTQNVSPSPVDADDKRSLPGTKSNMAPTSAFRRVQVGPNEVDYIAEDVTIRDFTIRPARRPTRVSNRQVNIGEDVTIRYFSNKPTADSQPAPVPISQTAR